MYITLTKRPTGLVFDYINNIGYVSVENDSRIYHIDLNAASLKSTSTSILSGTTPVHARIGTTGVNSQMAVFDPYRRKLLLVSPSTGTVIIVNTYTGLMELAETGLTITPYDSTILDLNSGYAYVLAGGQYLRIYSMDSSSLISVADLGVTGFRWLRLLPDGRVLAVGTGNPAPIRVYDPSTNISSAWTTATARTTADKSTVLYVAPTNTLVVVRDDNRLAFVTPTTSTNVDTTITSRSPILFYHPSLQRIILTSANQIKMYDHSGSVIATLTLPLDILSADIDIYHNVLAVATSSTLYTYKLTQNALELYETNPLATGSYYLVAVDSVFSRIYVLESDAYRIAMREFSEKLQVFLDVVRGASVWTGTSFNDQLTITVRTMQNEPVANATCNVSIFGNARLSINNELTESTTVLTGSNGTAQLTIRVTGPGAYTVYVRAMK